jgi:hypothetical protein
MMPAACWRRHHPSVGAGAGAEKRRNSPLRRSNTKIVGSLRTPIHDDTGTVPPTMKIESPTRVAVDPIMKRLIGPSM